MRIHEILAAAPKSTMEAVRQFNKQRSKPKKEEPKQPVPKKVGRPAGKPPKAKLTQTDVAPKKQPSSVSSLLQESKKMITAPAKTEKVKPGKPRKPVVLNKSKSKRCPKGSRKDQKTSKCKRYVKGSVSSIISGCY